ncbi:MAG: Gfo/Idh/MocA family oxidoreductase [Gemmatimonadota bacterium]
MQQSYTAAVVGGCGTWGRYYLRAYAAHPRCRLVALVDRARDRRDAFAARYGIGRVCDDVAELLAGGPPDLVAVSLPVAANPDAVIALALGGVRAISCEKPIAADLDQADEMVRVCRERGVPLGCGTACWELPHLLDTVQWVRDGHIGRLTAAAIPGGLPVEVSGAGCVQLTMMRRLTGMEVEWAEGWVEPADASFTGPSGAQPWEIDGPAHGRLGLSGDIVCQIPAPPVGRRVRCKVSVEGEAGRVWLGDPSVHVVDTGPEARPVFPEFTQREWDRDFFGPAITRLITALEAGQEALCSGHDYRQALEIAIALKLSARDGHQRVQLPLAARRQRLYPHPYRLQGGDVSGWPGGGYSGPPEVL